MEKVCLKNYGWSSIILYREVVNKTIPKEKKKQEGKVDI